MRNNKQWKSVTVNLNLLVKFSWFLFSFISHEVVHIITCVLIKFSLSIFI